MGTSSADPHKLDDYSTNGVEMVEELRTKFNDVTEALEALSASSSEHLPRRGGLDELLTDLVDDWQHLDEFVGDVARGFFAADDGNPRTGDVLMFEDSTLLAEGEIGYADRDQAIAEAEAMAEELDRLQEEGASAEEMDDFVAMAERGQYDPAFAVTFSEQAGVGGYADATALIRDAYESDDRDLGDAIPQVAVLSTVLTTALDTLPRSEEDEYRDSSNADLPAGARLDSDFVYDLTTGYEPEEWDGPERPDSHADLDDLSVVIGLSDPPTEVAIEIAENRMKPLIEDGNITDSRWREDNEDLVVQDPVVNYATMLARNEDASAGWLHGEGNIELVLDEPGSDCMDSGAALADVVEAALTNDDMHAPPPSGAPDYAEGGLIREDLMDRAITFVGDQDDEFDIPNEHMYDALASGVESNMSVIDQRINSGWSADGESYTHDDDNRSMTQTENFLTELMGDDGARDRVRDATTSYVQDQLDDLPADTEGAAADDRDHALNELGRVFGVASDADIDAMTGEFEQAEDEAALAGRVTDYVVSWTPLGKANDIANVVELNVGKWVAEGLGPDDEEFQDNLRSLLIDQRQEIEGQDLDSDDIAQMRRGADDAKLYSD